jgi:ribosomal protein S18 acetylase RimI-like enzyme
MNEISIVKFDAGNQKQMDVMASIHRAVLPDSFVVLMGNTFMKKFYYNVLPRLGYLNCFLAELNNEYVGIIVTNKKPFSLIRSSIPYHFFRITWVMVLALISNPKRIKVVIDLLKYKPDPLLKTFEDTGTAFEILTIGVLEEYRSVSVGNRKISHLLLGHIVDYYKKENYNKITGQILKSNKSALGFYSKYNASFIQSSVRDYGVILDLDINNIKSS